MPDAPTRGPAAVRRRIVEAAAIAKEHGEPVKLLRNRRQDVQSGVFRVGGFHHFKAGLDANGKLVAFRNNFVTYSNSGKIAGSGNLNATEFQQGYVENVDYGYSMMPLDIPTGLGKTSVMTIWLLARLENPNLPRRLVYVVDRRAVVDQATDEAERLAQRLAEHPDLCAALRLDPAAALTKRDGRRLALPVSTLRGQFADNRKWSENPAHPAIVVGTVDMIGSRLLFNGYRLSRKQWPVHAGLLAHDSLIVLDEAHLNAPFEGLLNDMVDIGRRTPGLPSVSRTLSLSATGAPTDRRNPMTIEAEDLAYPHVRRLLKAPKPLALKQPDGRKLPEQLTEEAWTLAAPENGPARRVLVFCNSREDAGKTAELLRKKLAEHGKTDTANRTRLFPRNRW